MSNEITWYKSNLYSSQISKYNFYLNIFLEVFQKTFSFVSNLTHPLSFSEQTGNALLKQQTCNYYKIKKKHTSLQISVFNANADKLHNTIHVNNFKILLLFNYKKKHIKRV